jgi:hypothetical protein
MPLTSANPVEFIGVSACRAECGDWTGAFCLPDVELFDAGLNHIVGGTPNLMA